MVTNAMLEALLGNSTAEKVLLYLYRFEKGYANEIASVFSIPVNGIQQQLKRFEEGGILVSHLYGKVRLYEFNPRYPFLPELQNLLKRSFDFIATAELDKYYMKRTRPRKQSKSV